MPPLVPEFLWTESWESEHNLSSRFSFKLSAPEANLALRLQVLDWRPASSVGAFTESFGGETADKALTQPGLGLYHLTTGSRLLYGTLDSYGLPARIRNVWIRGAPYAESRTRAPSDLKIAPASTAESQGYAYLETPDLSLGPGLFQAFASFTINDDPRVNEGWGDRSPALGFGADYALGKADFRLEGFYTGQTLPERKSSTWFNEKPALPARDSRLFAGAAAFSIPAFGLAADLAYSETFAFGSDYYGSLGLRFGDKPWRLSLVMDAAGSRYVDSAGNTPGAGFRVAARVERRSKKSGLLRLTVLARGPGPAQGTVPALTSGDFAAFAKGINRMSGELYCRLPASSASFGLTRFSLSFDRDGRNGKKVMDSANAMAAFKVGPVTSVSEGKITGISRGESSAMEGGGYALDSYRLTQRFSWTCSLPALRKTSNSRKPPKGENSMGENPGVENENTPSEKKTSSAKPKETRGQTTASAKTGGSKGQKAPSVVPEKKAPLTLQLSARAGYEKATGKDGVWDTSVSASVRGKKNRLTIKVASPDFPKKWEYTISWRMALP